MQNINMNPERTPEIQGASPEQRRILPEKYQGPIGRVRYTLDYTLAIGRILIRVIKGDPDVFPPDNK